MPILDDFADVLVHQIIWEAMTGRDTYGKPTFAAPQPFTARVDVKAVEVETTQGVVWRKRGTVYVGGTPLVKPGDRITLPDGSQPPILEASTTDDMEGVPYYTKVILG